MKRRYFPQSIKSILEEYGFVSVIDDEIPVEFFNKMTSTGIEIMISMQRNKWITVPYITINIELFEEDTELISYRLGEFSKHSCIDAWWSIRKEEKEESLQDIERIMKENLFPELERLESEKFVEEFKEQIQISEEIERKRG
jgi:hypothetical protein